KSSLRRPETNRPFSSVTVALTLMSSTADRKRNACSCWGSWRACAAAASVTASAAAEARTRVKCMVRPAAALIVPPARRGMALFLRNRLIWRPPVHVRHDLSGLVPETHTVAGHLPRCRHRDSERRLLSGAEGHDV